MKILIFYLNHVNIKNGHDNSFNALNEFTNS